MSRCLAAAATFAALAVSGCGTPATPTTATPQPASSSQPTTNTAAATSSATPQPVGFAPCPGNLTPTSGEPPASENGAVGACAAAAILYPAAGVTCHPPNNSTYSASTNCPLYPDLAAKLDTHPDSGSGGGADTLCGCQNSWQSVSYAVERSPDPTRPTTYLVRVTLDFGGGTPNLYVVSVQAVQSGSLVDDVVLCTQQGTGRSIMGATTATCP